MKYRAAYSILTHEVLDALDDRKRIAGEDAPLILHLHDGQEKHLRTLRKLGFLRSYSKDGTDRDDKDQLLTLYLVEPEQMLTLFSLMGSSAKKDFYNKREHETEGKD
ncbi:hypothetical protein [uncultured Mitsuokella sp.]|uniref:hypothetical protein n=1 Tax=uncultured Mitsuokella sp. TaxID=453120 RepID=UPI00266BFED4|nr:hypothetical protein [uncultured Mitsuokella sp.]